MNIENSRFNVLDLHIKKQTRRKKAIEHGISM